MVDFRSKAKKNGKEFSLHAISGHKLNSVSVNLNYAWEANVRLSALHNTLHMRFYTYTFGSNRTKYSVVFFIHLWYD